jgi:hypothetical protein
MNFLNFDLSTVFRGLLEMLLEVERQASKPSCSAQ